MNSCLGAPAILAYDKEIVDAAPRFEFAIVPGDAKIAAPQTVSERHSGQNLLDLGFRDVNAVFLIDWHRAASLTPGPTLVRLIGRPQCIGDGESECNCTITSVTFVTNVRGAPPDGKT